MALAIHTTPERRTEMKRNRAVIKDPKKYAVTMAILVAIAAGVVLIHAYTSGIETDAAQAAAQTAALAEAQEEQQEEQNDEIGIEVTRVQNNIYRVVDHNYGVVCFTGAQSISCVRMGEQP
jgi:hypothetical protein